MIENMITVKNVDVLSSNVSILSEMGLKEKRNLYGNNVKNTIVFQNFSI